MAAGDSCLNCKYVGQRPKQTPQGSSTMLMCRRQPPVVFAQFFMLKNDDGQLAPQELTNTYWPVVQQTDWCGEHVVEIPVSSGLPQMLRKS